MAQIPTEPDSDLDDEDKALIGNYIRARAAIVAKIGPWKGRAPDLAGVIDCPVCGGVAALRYRRAGINGHIHAFCATADCVSWCE